MGLFADLQIALDLGINLNFKKKVELKKAIINNGGTISFIVTKKCHLVLTSEPEKCEISSKCRMALKYGLPVLKLDFIWDCISEGEVLSFDDYVVGGKNKALDFKSGIISVNKSGDQKKKKSACSRTVFNPRSVRTWTAKDPSQPYFVEEKHEVAKYAVFNGYNSVTNCENTHVVELQAPSCTGQKLDSNRETEEIIQAEPFPFRVLYQSGSTKDMKDGRPSQSEVRYTVSADQALKVYAMLVASLEKKPGFELCTSPVRGLGSSLLQKKMSEAAHIYDGCSEEVRNLVEHVWREAMSEVTSLLGDIKRIKLETVEQAEAILTKVQNSQGDKEVQDGIQEFYSTLPHESEDADSVLASKVPWKKWLMRKRDLCQLVRDMASVSEATNYESQALVEAKYCALRCRITALEGSLKEEVQEMVYSSLKENSDLHIHNVYEVWRQEEDVDFRHDLDTKRLLYHSSRVENFVGILSRGLLLPKVVVDKYGGQRTDAGNLGGGIYFADSASTSIKYSAPSSCKGTRLLLVNEVALGKTKEFLAPDTSLVAAPEGFDSTHGVSRARNEESQFEDDEYVVYGVNQQRVRYLVEFSVGADPPAKELEITSEEDCYIPRSLGGKNNSKDINLKDVAGIADPMEDVKAGLIATGSQDVELRGVHIRAKLVDLAAQVVVLQEYYNNSKEAVEAKYVFPLGEAAAVCGFEAFINGKHIVGEVKEKEKAHKEYKEAISQGHGAYLMDQEKETPDVFTVSVGNLPPGAFVLIKITYVSELKVEDEKINFRLPGTVAPWTEKAALLHSTQAELESHTMTAASTTVQVAIEMPFEIRTLHCPTHKVKIKQTASKAFVELAGRQDFGSGFLLLVGLAELHVPRMWVEKHPELDHQACMLTFYPEFESEEYSEGELVILVDLSNSMKGTQVLKLALLTLENIPLGFRFNVVRFGSVSEELFAAPRMKTEETTEMARHFLESSNPCQGSTDIRAALRPLHLLPPGMENGTDGSDSIRNVLLLSDGYLNEEARVLEEAARHHGHTRVFTFGLSATCNSHTLRALARVSAGAFEYFDPKVKSKWEPKVKSQIRRAMQPALTSVAVEWRQYDEDLAPPVQAPRQITALFNGSQQIIYGFVPNCTMANLRAVVGGQEVSTVVSTSELSITEGLMVHRLTARAIIQDWEAGVLARDRTLHELTKMDLKDYIIETSKEYSIVTQFTSFIAVEKREENEKEMLPKGPSLRELLDKEVVDNLPYMGWTSEPEPTLESLMEDLTFEDLEVTEGGEGQGQTDTSCRRAEKTAMLERLYQGQRLRVGASQLDMLHAVGVLGDSYRRLGDTGKASQLTLKALKDAALEADQMVSDDNYSKVANKLAEMKSELVKTWHVAEASNVFIPWPEKGCCDIEVMTLTGTTHKFCCNKTMNVRDIKQNLYDQTGKPVDTQRIVFGGKQLEDSATLEDCGAGVGATMHLLERLRGGGGDLPSPVVRGIARTEADMLCAAYSEDEESLEDDDIYEAGHLLFGSAKSKPQVQEPVRALKPEPLPGLMLAMEEVKLKQKKLCSVRPEEDESEDEEMGFGLFDGDYDERSIKEKSKPQKLTLVHHRSKEMGSSDFLMIKIGSSAKPMRQPVISGDTRRSRRKTSAISPPSLKQRAGRPKSGGIDNSLLEEEDDGMCDDNNKAVSEELAQPLYNMLSEPFNVMKELRPAMQHLPQNFSSLRSAGRVMHESTASLQEKNMGKLGATVDTGDVNSSLRQSAMITEQSSDILINSEQQQQQGAGLFGFRDGGLGMSAPMATGFGGSAKAGALFDNAPMGSQAPQQPTFGAATFGSPAPQQPTFGGASFGSSAPQQPTFGGASFGSSAPQQPTFGGASFGSSAPQQPTFGGASFGSSAPQQPTFGGASFGSQALQQPTFGAASFGSSAPQQPTFGAARFGSAPLSHALARRGAPPPPPPLGSAPTPRTSAQPPTPLASATPPPRASGPPPPPRLRTCALGFARASPIVRCNTLQAEPPPSPPRAREEDCLASEMVDWNSLSSPPPRPRRRASGPLSTPPPRPRASGPPPIPLASASPAMPQKYEEMVDWECLPPPPPPRARGPPPPPPPPPPARAPPPLLRGGPGSQPPSLSKKSVKKGFAIASQLVPCCAPAPPQPLKKSLSTNPPAHPSPRFQLLHDIKTHSNTKKVDMAMNIPVLPAPSPSYSPTSPSYETPSRLVQTSGKTHGGVAPVSWRSEGLPTPPPARSELKSALLQSRLRLVEDKSSLDQVYLDDSFIYEGRNEDVEKSKEPLLPIFGSMMKKRVCGRSRSRGLDEFKAADKYVPMADAKKRSQGGKLHVKDETKYDHEGVALPEAKRRKPMVGMSLSTWGIGTDLSELRVVAPTSLPADTVNRLLGLQREGQYWELDQHLDKLLGINTSKIASVLQSSGLPSLGKLASLDIRRMLATVLVLFVILKRLVPEVGQQLLPETEFGAVTFFQSLEWNKVYSLLGESFPSKPVEDLTEALLCALKYCQETDRKYPAAYSTLELGHSWLGVARSIMVDA